MSTPLIMALVPPDSAQTVALAPKASAAGIVDGGAGTMMTYGGRMIIAMRDPTGVLHIYERPVAESMYAIIYGSDIDPSDALYTLLMAAGIDISSKIDAKVALAGAAGLLQSGGWVPGPETDVNSNILAGLKDINDALSATAQQGSKSVSAVNKLADGESRSTDKNPGKGADAGANPKGKMLSDNQNNTLSKPGSSGKGRTI